MNELLLYLTVGVLCLLGIACVVALAWLLDDRKTEREFRASMREYEKAAGDWYQSPHKGHPRVRANRDREVV